VVCDEDGLVTLVYAVPPRLAELGIRLAELKPEDPEYQVVADDGINSRLIVRIGDLGTSALRKVVRLRLRRVQQAPLVGSYLYQVVYIKVERTVCLSDRSGFRTGAIIAQHRSLNRL
jgi:hypothetical protein